MSRIQRISMLLIILIILIERQCSGNEVIFHPTVGLEMEANGIVYLHNGMTYHDVIIGLPATLEGYHIRRPCDVYEDSTSKDLPMIPNEAEYILEKTYQHQLTILQKDIPESNLLDQIGYTRENKKLRDHEPIKRHIASIQRNIERYLQTRVKISDENNDKKLSCDSKTLTLANKQRCLDEKIQDILGKPLKPTTLKKMETNYTQLSREKRLAPLIIPVIAGISVLLASTGVGIAIYNTNRISTLTDRLEAVDVKMMELVDNMNRLAINEEAIISRMNNLTLLTLPLLTKELGRMKRSLTCESTNSIITAIESSVWLAAIPAKIMRIMNNAYHGRLTPDIYPYHMVVNQLLKREDFINSVYSEKPELVYELGTFVILRVAHLPFILQGLIILPNIRSPVPNIRYRTNTVNFVNKGMNMLVNVPKTLVSDTESNFYWTYNKDECIESPRFSTCPINYPVLHYHKCITSVIVDKSIESCNLMHIPNNKTIIQQTHAGLLIGTTFESYKEYIIKSSGMIKASERLPSTLPILITTATSNISYVEIESQTYLLTDDHIEYNISIIDELKVDVSNITVDTDAILIPTFDPLPNPDLRVPDYIPYHDRNQYIGLITLFVMISFLFILIILINKRSNKYNPIQAKYWNQPLEIVVSNDIKE